MTMTKNGPVVLHMEYLVIKIMDGAALILNFHVTVIMVLTYMKYVFQLLNVGRITPLLKVLQLNSNVPSSVILMHPDVQYFQQNMGVLKQM